MIGTLMDWLYPPSCPGCGRAGGMDFCTACGERLPSLPPLEVDGVPLVGAGPYAGPMRAAVLALKAGGRTALADPLAGRMAEAARPLAGNLAAVVEVPADPVRLRYRGFHAPTLLARGVARRLGLPHRPDLLRCAGPLPTQRGLSREDRLANLRGLFEARAERGHGVLLVDDVVTTGATVRECARALRRAGAGRVVAVAAGVNEMLTPPGCPGTPVGAMIATTSL